jgi:hypothetical protein
MLINKFQLGCIFLVLNSMLWVVYLNLQVEDLLCFSIISFSQVPIHAFFPLPLPLLSLLYRLATSSLMGVLSLKANWGFFFAVDDAPLSFTSFNYENIPSTTNYHNLHILVWGDSSGYFGCCI